MPIVQTYPDDFGDNAKEEYLKRQLLEKIASAKFEVRKIYQKNINEYHLHFFSLFIENILKRKFLSLLGKF